MKTPRISSKWLRRTGTLFIIAGMISLGIFGWSYARRAVIQSRSNSALDRLIETRRETPFGPAVPGARPLPPPPDGALIGRLSIPRLNLHAAVREGAGKDTLEVALGHIPGTVLPGQTGNSGIAGHRDTLFRGLRNVRANDTIEFQTASGNYRYRVESTQIVKPDNVSVLKPGRYSQMTLVTCYPFYYVGSAPDRFIVKARLLDEPGDAITAQPVSDVSPTPAVASPKSVKAAPLPNVRKIEFHVSQSGSRELAPGIRLGVLSTDPVLRRADVWMLMTPEQRTLSFKSQRAHEPVFFYAHDDGKQRELMITSVNADSVTGYLLLYRPALSPSSR